MSEVKELVGKLAEASRQLSDKKGVRMTVALSAKNHDLLAQLAKALDVPSGVLAARLLAAALRDAEERASDLDLFDQE